MVQMLGVFAEFERATIIDRVVAGMERKAARGGWNGGERPFGYLIDREAGCLTVCEAEAPLVPLIFDLYVNKRLGTRAVGEWLNRNGHRTKAGKHWSHMSVLTVLRNRAYLGEIFFRGEHHRAPHPALVEADTFDAAQQLLAIRGENYSKRATNASDYLLAGLLVCDRCGKGFIGTAAQGNKYRYRYYTCFSRHRYGLHACDQERLPAEELDRAVLASMLETYADSRLVERAIAEAIVRANAAQPRHQQELEAVQAEMRKAEESLDRYFEAFESGDMSQATAGTRVEAIGRRLRELRLRTEELEQLIQDESLPTFSPDLLETVRGQIRQAIESGTPQQRKALAQELVSEVRVKGRDWIQPVFRVPNSEQVRPLSRVVRLAGIEPATSCSAGMRSIR